MVGAAVSVAVGVASLQVLTVWSSSSTVGETASPADPAGQLAGLVRSPTPTILLDDVVAIDGAPFAFKAAPGGLLLLYFGYLSCPDVCPTTLADLKSALADLGDDEGDVAVAMITIDPQRDTSVNLRSYLDHFIDSARGIRIEQDAVLRHAADAFGATYNVSIVNGVVEVSHTGFVYVIDDAGRLLEQWPFGTPATDMTSDLRLLAG